MILMITVVLFSSIIGFVQQMPVPQKMVKASFDATVSFLPGGTKANLTVTHAGGDPMDVPTTLIIVDVGSTSKGYNLTKDSSFAHAKRWVTGQPWNVQLTGTTYTTIIVVTVFDNSKHATVWTSQVTGGTGGSPPNIMQRWVDSNRLTPTADPVRQYDNFSFYVVVEDPDNDLNTSAPKFWIDTSQIEGANGTHRTNWTLSGTNTYRWDFNIWRTGKPLTAAKLDGAIIYIHAWDKAGHEAISTFVMHVTVLPTNTNVFPPITIITGGNVGENGLPAYLTWTSSKQGFGVYEENHTSPGSANVSRPKLIFDKDENIFVRVASLTMNNIVGDNRIMVVDTRTGAMYQPDYRGQSTNIAPFYPFTASGSAFIYECVFNTSNLPPSSYSMDIFLSNAPAPGDPTQKFTTEQLITVQQANSPITFIPTIYLYEDPSRTVLWGTKTKPYDISGGTYMLYVSVLVMDAQAPPPAPSCDQIQINDMIGGSQIFAKPPALPMLTALSRQSSSPPLYKFDIDLRYANGNQWLGGVNAYTLHISKFSDLNEGVYSLSQQVYVKSSIGRADFFTGEDGINVGHANFDTKAYLTYIQNNNFFSQQTLYQYTNTPSDKTTYTTTALAIGDISGDGDKDILIGQDTTYALVYFKNSLNTYGGWQDGSAIPRPSTDAANTIKWITIGDINADGLNDFAYVSSANKIVIYNNSYGISGWIYKDYGATVVKKIMLRDMTGDGKADLIILAGGKIYVNDLTKVGSIPAVSPEVATLPVPKTDASGVTDFDIADMNQDGMLDILTVGSGGIANMNGAWVNLYYTNPTPTVKKLDAGATGYGPIPRIGAGTRVQNGVVETQAQDGIALIVRENTTADPQPQGKVNFTMKFDQLNATDKSQILHVVARLNSSADQIFYAWYSLDGNVFIPMFAITNKVSWNDYSFRMPASVAGNRIFLRFTDSSTTVGSGVNAIEVDYVAILANTYGNYWGPSAGVRGGYQVVGTSPITYTTIRAGNIDGDGNMTGVPKAGGNLEAIVAVNGVSGWRVYEGSTFIGNGWNGSNANFFTVSSNALMANTAPTLFDVVDINGDGYSDILLCNRTTVQNTVSQLGYYLNLYPAKVFYRVAELGVTGGAGAITCAVAANLNE